jgi:hypothetical protein
LALFLSPLVDLAKEQLHYLETFCRRTARCAAQ